MKKTITLICFFIIVGCKNNHSANDERIIKMDLTGTWRFQSSTDDYIRDHQIIILEDSTYFKFSRTNGGGLLEKGYLSKNDSLVNEQGLKNGLKKIDTNKIEIENHYNFFGDFVNAYEKNYYDYYKDELKKRLKIDSIRNLALGWWKLTKSKSLIELPNFSGEYETLTMQIETEGRARFYLNNYLDSIVDYSYRIRENGIDFGRGDVAGSGTKMFFESNSTMKMIFNSRRTMINDTLELKKIYKLN